MLGGALAASALLITGCSQAMSMISPAYKAGYEIGKEFGSYVNNDQIDTINSWLPEEDKLDFGKDISSSDVDALCKSMFDVSGLLAGLKNTDKNRAEFKQGCEVGFYEAKNA